MRKLFEQLHRRLSAGQDLAMVTVAARRGSAPRGPGARMLASAAGRCWGSVGGGAVEQAALALAQSALLHRRCLLQEFQLEPDGPGSIDMLCGGGVTLLVQSLPGGDPDLLALSHAALEAIQAGQTRWLFTQADGPDAGRMRLLTQGQAAAGFPCAPLTSGLPVLFSQDGLRWFAQRLSPEGMVYVFGAGHVARELSPLLSRLSFPFTVADDRADFLSPAAFPGAQRLIHTPFDALPPSLSLRPCDWAVVMTHGHRHDLAVQHQLLSTPVGYIGVMGSLRKREAVLQQLLELGHTPEELSRITTPIGLPLGGETPAEIALSIAAQLVQLRAAGKISQKGAPAP